MKTLRNLDMLHPIAVQCVKRIQSEVIDKHNMPFKLFETGRDNDRHTMLISKGKTRSYVSGHLYNLENTPPLYATAFDYVYYDKKWSWNLRDTTISAWYQTFGNLTLDACPELKWSGLDRKAINYCHFELRHAIVLENLDKYPCVAP